MILKPTIKATMNKPQEEPKKKTRKKQENKLPSDEYKPMFPPKRILVRETASSKDPTNYVRQYIEVSVKRFNDDIGLPYVFIQMYQEAEFYTGYLRGKSVYLPLEMFYDFMDTLKEVDEECDKRHIE